MENENLEVQESVAVGTDSTGELNREYVYENRRYVGLKETVWYVIYDMCQSFNIDSFSDRFVTNILQIDLDYQYQDKLHSRTYSRQKQHSLL